MLKVYKSDYTNRSMKVKSATECCEMNGQHGYLGEHRNNLEKGHTHGGQIGTQYGTSKLSNEAGVVPKGKDTKYT